MIMSGMSSRSLPNGSEGLPGAQISVHTLCGIFGWGSGAGGASAADVSVTGASGGATASGSGVAGSAAGASTTASTLTTVSTVSGSASAFDLQTRNMVTVALPASTEPEDRYYVPMITMS